MSDAQEIAQPRIHSKILERKLSTKKLVGEFIQDLDSWGALCISWNTTCTCAASRHFQSQPKKRKLKDSCTGKSKGVGVAALFLAAKYEDEPRPLEHVIKVSHMYMYKGAPLLDVNSKVYVDKKDQVLTLENILLQTLGFNLEVEPHALSKLMKESAENEKTSSENSSSHSGTKRKLSLNEYRNSKKAKVGSSPGLPLSQNVNKVSCVPSAAGNSAPKLSLNSNKENFRAESCVNRASTESSVKWRLIPLTLSPPKKSLKRRVLSFEDYRKRK